MFAGPYFLRKAAYTLSIYAFALPHHGHTAPQIKDESPITAAPTVTRTYATTAVAYPVADIDDDFARLDKRAEDFCWAL